MRWHLAVQPGELLADLVFGAGFCPVDCAPHPHLNQLRSPAHYALNAGSAAAGARAAHFGKPIQDLGIDGIRLRKPARRPWQSPEPGEDSRRRQGAKLPPISPVR